MARSRTLISNFNAGEFTPRLDVRSDLQRYFAACALNENFHILTQGGVAKRMGTLVDGRTPADAKALLVGFTKSAFDSVMLEFSALKMRVWLPNYELVQAFGGGVYELATPWTEADLPVLAFSQSSDVVFITRRDCNAAIMCLQRRANNDWSIVPHEARNGPFLPLGEPGVTLTASATTGTGITLTASAAVFSAANVGGIYRIRENVGNPPVLRWEAAKAVVASNRRQNGGRVYEAISGGTTGNSAPIHWEGNVSDGAVTWSFVHDGAGVVKITGFTSATVVTANVLAALPTTGATTFWEEGCFSPLNGYPAACTIHQERFFAAQTRLEPDTFYASASGGYGPDYADFKPGLGTGLIVDSDAVKRTVTGGKVRPILHLVSAGALYAFTPKTIEVITGPSDREPITPAGAAAMSRPGYGASPWVTPLRGADELLYVSFSGRKLLSMPWGDQGGDGRARDLSVMAEHLGRLGRFVAVALSEDPEPTIWVLDEKGRLYGCAYAPAQDVVGWWRVVIMGAGGKPAIVESIAAMERPDGKDELWLSVNRDGRRTIEHMPDFITPETPRDLRCGLDGAYFWNQWNGNKAKNVWLTAPLQRDQIGTLSANHAAFQASDIGRQIWLRMDQIENDRVTTLGPVKLEVTAFGSATSVSVKALTTVPADFMGYRDGFAWPLGALAGMSLWADRGALLFADGEDRGQKVPNGIGTLVLDRLSARGFFGAAYDAKMQLLPFDMGSDIGTAFGGKLRADRMTVLVQDAVELLVGPKNGQKEVINVRTARDLMSQAPMPRDRVRTVPFPGDWGDVLDAEIISEGPWPCELAGLSMRVTVND